MANKTIHEGGNPFAALAEVLEEHAAKIARQVSYRLAGRYAGRVREAVLAQEFIEDWPPLNPEYLERKRKLKFDTRMLRATGEYINSIVPRLSHDGESYVVAPGDRPHTPNALSKSEINLIYLGEILEYGATIREDSEGNPIVKIPPRPHWRPVWDEFMRTFPTSVAEFQGAVWKDLEPILTRELRRIEGEKK